MGDFRAYDSGAYKGEWDTSGKHDHKLPLAPRSIDLVQRTANDEIALEEFRRQLDRFRKGYGVASFAPSRRDEASLDFQVDPQPITAPTRRLPFKFIAFLGFGKAA